MADDFIIGTQSVLTDREAQVILWTAKGKTGWEVGQILSISEGTVRAHLVHVLEKLDASNKAHAVARCFVSGIFSIKNVLVMVLVSMMSSHVYDHEEMRTRTPSNRRAECRQVLSAGSRCRV